MKMMMMITMRDDDVGDVYDEDEEDEDVDEDYRGNSDFGFALLFACGDVFNWRCILRLSI